MATYCGDYCEVFCKSCKNYNFKTKECKVKLIKVNKYDYCNDDFDCKLTGLSSEEIEQLVKKQKEEGFYDD